MNVPTTPGVYVEEIATLPPSVAQVATAIPAFIGYTQKGPATPTRLSSMLEFETIFGGPEIANFNVTINTDTKTGVSTIAALTKTPKAAQDDKFILYYCMQLFFANGGSSCYIASVGNYENGKSQKDFSDGLKAIKKMDEPTLLVLSDALSLGAQYEFVCQEAMQQCKDLGDRFTIIDLAPDDNTGATFRNWGLNNLSYGAAYTPHLRTALAYKYEEKGVTVKNVPAPLSWTETVDLQNGGILGVQFLDTEDVLQPMVKFVQNNDDTVVFAPVKKGTLTIKLPAYQKGDVNASPAVPTSGVKLKDLKEAWDTQVTVAAKGNFSLSFSGDLEAFIDTEAVLNNEKQLTDHLVKPPGSVTQSMKELNDPKNGNTSLYNLVRAKLSSEYVTLPPSAAMAGIYAQVDSTRGVWKAPANIAVSSVIGPTTVISHEEQGRLNVDPTSGKSINAIRAFPGKGTLVWGARTLAGNDNEWRYISVRRLFITIEESTRKATAFAVFEPNDATTWLKVKAMIDSYLYGLWQQGALAGPKPESSYFVNVGLGKTMTTQDILEGRMIVEIGIAAVRPAEFIMLRFSHKLQEA